MNNAITFWLLGVVALAPFLRPSIPALPPSPLPAAIVAIPEPDLDALYRTVWGEVRGQGAEEQAAVVHVILNRWQSGRWGSLRDTVLARKQFSVWNRNDPNYPLVSDPALPRRASFQRVAALCDTILRLRLEGGPDFTGGADHYHHGLVPYWGRNAKGRRIGGALFYRLRRG